MGGVLSNHIRGFTFVGKEGPYDIEGNELTLNEYYFDSFNFHTDYMLRDSIAMVAFLMVTQFLLSVVMILRKKRIVSGKGHALSGVLNKQNVIGLLGFTVNFAKETRKIYLRKLFSGAGKNHIRCVA